VVRARSAPLGAESFMKFLWKAALSHGDGVAHSPRRQNPEPKERQAARAPGTNGPGAARRFPNHIAGAFACKRQQDSTSM
jgi:hypothetical protein